VVSTLVVDRIGLLVTNDPALGDGPLGLVRDAAVVVEGDRVLAVERAGHAAADERLDAGGRCVVPGSSTATPTSSSPATAATSSRRGWPARPTPPAGSA
jgi:hypothetical protein